MASLILARAADDLLLDYYKTKLETFHAAQLVAAAASSPVIPTASVQFEIDRDKQDAWNTDKPLVNLILDTDTYESKGSGVRTIRNGRLTLKAECWAPLHASRLYYLKAQALAGLFAVDADPDLGLGDGFISSIAFPTWTPKKLNEDYPETEVPLFGGEWSWEIVTAWSPDIATSPALSEISGTTLHQWAVDYHYA